MKPGIRGGLNPFELVDMDAPAVFHGPKGAVKCKTAWEAMRLWRQVDGGAVYGCRVVATRLTEPPPDPVGDRMVEMAGALGRAIAASLDPEAVADDD